MLSVKEVSGWDNKPASYRECLTSLQVIDRGKVTITPLSYPAIRVPMYPKISMNEKTSLLTSPRNHESCAPDTEDEMKHIDIPCAPASKQNQPNPTQARLNHTTTEYYARSS